MSEYFGQRERTPMNYFFLMQMTRRQYLTLKAMEGTGGTLGMLVAIEAVSSTAIEHPEWDMDEEREFVEWEKGKS